MNVNELADLIGMCGDGGYNQDAAAMLRKQANRIKVLEANHKIQININEKALQYIDHLEQGLRASIDLNNAQAKRAQEE